MDVDNVWQAATQLFTRTTTCQISSRKQISKEFQPKEGFIKNFERAF